MNLITTDIPANLCLILCCLLIWCTTPVVIAQSQEWGTTPAQIQDGWRTAAPEEVGFDPARVNELTKSLRNGEHGNVHALLIEKDGLLVYEEYFTGEDEAWGANLGTVTFGRSSLHDLRSVTKSVISTLIGIAIERGEIPSVDTPLHALLPDYAHLLQGEKENIRLQHILTMSAGLKWDERSIPYSNPANDERRLNSSSDPIAMVLSREQVFEPGEKFTYSGGLTQVLAAILERATNREIGDYARDVLFEPLGIYDVVWRGNLNGIPAVASGMRLQARDLAKLGSIFLHDGQWNGEQIIPRKWVDQSTRGNLNVTYPGDSMPEFVHEIDYGYQWWIGNYQTTRGVIEVPMMAGNGEQRVMVVPELGIVLTVFGGEYGRVTGMADRLLVEHIIEAMAR